MSNCTLTLSDGTLLEVMRADVLFPYFGNWTAHCMIAEASSAPAGSCVLTCYEKEFIGSILSSRSGESAGRFYCMVVGGNGGLSSDISAQGYNYQIKINLPLEQMLSSVGESISIASSQKFLNQIIPSWSRLAGSVSIELSRLIDSVGGIWRVMPDGGIFVGNDDFNQVEPFEYAVEFQDPIHANVKLHLQTLDLLPGTRFPESSYESLSHRKIGACRYEFSEDSCNAMVWFLNEKGMYTDALHEGIEHFIKEVMRGVDYLAEYPCQVLLQRTDGTIDIQPDSSKIPPMTSVPVRVIPPGIKIKVPSGSRGNLVFEGGNPQGFAFHASEMGAGGRKVSGVGDKVNLGYLVLVKDMTGAVTGITWNSTAGDVELGPGTIKTGWPNLEIGSEMS